MDKGTRPLYSIGPMRSNSKAPSELQVELNSLKPMLLGQAKRPFDDPHWDYQLKYDGYRLLAAHEGDTALLKSRNGANATAWFPELVEGLNHLEPQRCVLDGEVCVLDSYGRTDFNRLHERALARRYKPGLALVVYCVFDVLVHRGKDVRALPLQRRQKLLEQLFRRPTSSMLRVTGFRGEGNWLFEQACALELEGIVAKRLDAPYASGVRSDAWLKIKRKGAVTAQRFVRETLKDPLA